MKISKLQVFWIIITFITGNTYLLVISPAIFAANQDAWISLFVAGISGILVVFISSKVGLLYPNHTLIEYSKLILGKWLGAIIVILYLIQWYSVIGNIMVEFSLFAITILLPTTPPLVLFLTMLTLMVYVVSTSGIEGIARCSEVFGPIVILSLIILILLSIPNMELHQLLPVFSDTGWPLIFKGALYPLSFFGESVFMLMLVSFMDQPKKGPISATKGLAVTISLVSIIALSVLAVFGPEVAGKLRYPAFDMFRFINAMGFIQNLEILAVLVWILSVFIKLSLYFFLASYGTAQFFNIKDWRKTIWFVAAVSLVMAIIFSNYAIHGMQYIQTFWLPYVLPANIIGIPLLLLLVGSIRKKRTP